MDHDMHDDGLVHGHDWAKEPARPVAWLHRPANDVHAPEVAQAMSVKQDDFHDDGLVHGHAWARG